MLTMRRWPCVPLYVCIIGISVGCSGADRIAWPLPPLPKASLGPVEYAFTGYGGTNVNAVDNPVEYVREALYHEPKYREARAVMEANGLDGFQSMVLLYIGGDEHTTLVWAFNYRQKPYCFTSFYPEEITADAVNCSGRELSTRVQITGHEYECAMAAIATVSGKGDVVVGEARKFYPGCWAHVVAYDREKGWFIRSTTVDPEILSAIDLLLALGTFSTELSKDAVVARTERELAQNEQTKSTKECRRLLRIVEQNWDGCLPFLAVMHLMLPEPRWRRELRQEILNN